jgi:hypothetical protein
MSRAALAVALCAVALYFLPDLLQGDTVFTHDTANIAYPWRRWQVMQLQKGELALWNPRIYSGIYAANPIMSRWSPFQVFYWLWDGVLAHQLNLMAHGLLAAAGMAGLAACLGAAAPLAASAGIAFALSGSVVSMHANFPYFTSAAVIPWVFWMWFRGPWHCGVALALVAYEGDPILMVVLAGALALVAVRQRVLVPLVITLASAAGLAAIVWWPALDLLQDLTRASGFSFAQITNFSVHPVRALELLSPGLFGDFGGGSFWGAAFSSAPGPFVNFWYGSVFVGYFVLALLFDGVRRAPRSAVGLACALLILAMGRHVPLSQWWFGLPGAEYFRYPAKLLLPALAVLLSLLAYARPRVPHLLWAAGGLAVCGAILNLVFTPADYSPFPEEHAARVVSFMQGRALTLLAFALACFAGAWALRATSWPWLLPVLVLAELWLFAPVHPKASRASMDALASAPGLRPDLRIFRDPWLDRSPDGDGARTLRMHWAMLQEVGYAFGDDGVYPADLRALHDENFVQDFQRWSQVLAIDAVLTTPEPAPYWQGHIDAGVLRAGPRFQDASVWWTDAAPCDAPGGRCALLLRENDAALFSVDSPAGTVLRMRGRTGRFWRAQVDGKDEEMTHGEPHNAEVWVPAGPHTVRFWFRPTSFRAGLAVTGIAALVLLARALHRRKAS